MRCFASEKQHQCTQWLPLVEWWYNNTYHKATKMGPYEIIYGQFFLMISYLLGTSRVHAINNFLDNHNITLCTLKEKLEIIQNHLKQ